MRREVRNYLFMGMGFSVILLLIMWDLLTTINYLLRQYNDLIYNYNYLVEDDVMPIYLNFFGSGVYSTKGFMDIILTIVFIIVICMVYFKIKWSVTHETSPL